MVSVFGADSETDANGQPFTLQLHSEFASRILWVNHKSVTRRLLSFLDQTISVARSPAVFYVHNLEFDLVSFFYPHRDEFLNGEFDFTVDGWRIEGVYSNVKFARLTKGRRLVWMVDTGTFFRSSLAKAAELVCPKFPKLPTPKGLGQKKFKPSDKKFCAYAIRDAVIAYYLGRRINSFILDYDIPQIVSAPHAAARIFRRKFLKHTIALPPRNIMYAALRSYHGGKNGLYVKPGWYEKLYALDIVSAYPWAMRQLPAFSGDFYSKLSLDKSAIGNRAKLRRLPMWGVYCVSGTATNCKWPSLFDHRFKSLAGKTFRNVWITGPELLEAIRCREVKISKLWGYFYDHHRDAALSPFKAFVDHFYELKSTAADLVFRAFYKLMMNSLYGKFIQKIPTASTSAVSWDERTGRIKNVEPILVAGGLFQPFVATLITGLVRARIHRLEHKYRALHTATDGILSRSKPAKTSSKLGGLTIECFADHLAIIRNKLYIAYTKKKPKRKGGKKPLASAVYKGAWILKFALHGFHAKIWELERLLVSGRRYYEYVKVNKLRESKRRGLDVNRFQNRVARLKLKEEIDNA